MEAKFLRKVEKTESCWNWTGRLDVGGYGRFSRVGIWKKAHRTSYELYKGPIPEGLVVRHMCNNCKCVNPEHLQVGTHKDNVADMDKAGRRADIRGEKNPSCKVSDSDVVEIRQWRELGYTQQSIADAFGVSQGQVCVIVNRKQRI